MSYMFTHRHYGIARSIKLPGTYQLKRDMFLNFIEVWLYLSLRWSERKGKKSMVLTNRGFLTNFKDCVIEFVDTVYDQDVF